MNHDTSAVMPLDPELVQGDTDGQRSERCGLLQGSVRPVRVAEIPYSRSTIIGWRRHPQVRMLTEPHGIPRG
jgi:hypothetical protein